MNTVNLVANLTRDPELREYGDGKKVCDLRIAFNDRNDDPNYIDVSVFGVQGENCHRFLSKGRKVAITGRLKWREWDGEGGKRSAISIIASDVQFLSGPRSDDEPVDAGEPVEAPALA